MAKECTLTTFDNPYDPFEQFNQWFMFDVEKGYYSCSRLARIAKLSDDMTQKEVDEEVERAIDEIIKYDPFNIYKKATREVADEANEPDDPGKEDLTGT